MKKIIGVLSLAVMMLTLSSCEVETSQNGDLDGFWHLELVDTLATGGTCNFADKRVFWGCQYKLIQVADYDYFGDGRGFYLRFEQTSDSLLITSVYRNKWHEDYGGDVLLTEMNDSLRSCGINHLNEHFAKEVMTGGKMQLKSKTLRLRFRKF